jgi:hypothetical protein
MSAFRRKADHSDLLTFGQPGVLKGIYKGISVLRAEVQTSILFSETPRFDDVRLACPR